MRGTRERLVWLDARSREGRAAWRPPVFEGIDSRLPFVPEAFTQLYHLPVYRALSLRQRLRYNQLFGLRTNEMFMVFEKGVTAQILTHLGPAMAGDRALGSRPGDQHGDADGAGGACLHGGGPHRGCSRGTPPRASARRWNMRRMRR